MNEEKRIDDLVENYIQDRKDNQKLILSNGQLILDKLYENLLKHGGIDFEDLGYHPEEYSISEKELELLADYLCYCDRKYLHHDDEISFPNESVFIDYNESHLIEYFQMSGQGVFSLFKLLEKDSVDPNIMAMKFDELLDKLRVSFSS